MLNELRYNVGDFDRVDEEDGILVFKGNVYPIFTTDTSEENIQYVLNILRELCKVSREDFKKYRCIGGHTAMVFEDLLVR